MNQESMAKRIFNFSLVQIVLATLLGVFPAIAVNKLLFTPIFEGLGLDENYYMIRVVLGALIMMPLMYEMYFKKIYKQTHSSFDMRVFIKDGAVGLGIGFLSVSFIMVMMYMLGAYRIDGVNTGFEFWNVIGMVFVLAFTEEVVFRGILYRILEEKHNSIIALAASSVLFSIAHVTNDHFNVMSLVVIVVAGLMIGIMYTYTKNLWLAVFMHFSWNYTQVIYGMTVSGTDVFNEGMVLNNSISGPTWITGGQFGPENSVFALLATVIVFVFYYYLCIKNKKIVY